MTTLMQLTGLSPTGLMIVVTAVFMAGLIRGFAGFGLSAVVMASAATILPPIELIPTCYLLEGAASLAMFRGGMADADMKIVWGLVICSAIGMPLGLLATTSVDVETSRNLALSLILALTLAQFFKLRPKFLATPKGLYASGLTAGIATGLASVGGMVIALYVLASGTRPKQMRASLVMFLCISMFTSLVWLIAYDMMSMQAVWRGALMAPVVLIGVFAGTWLFRPAYEPLYKVVCLTLLTLLSATGLISQIV
ncbi:MAG: TSUP family transporter [Hoeflea sp.]|uniref:TSUP family transporter n=1 Tax=Hoeflea sp. TaxID=1940281 RepID=UPI003EF3045C